MNKKLVISTVVCCSLMSASSFASVSSQSQAEVLKQLQTKVVALEKEIAQLQKTQKVSVATPSKSISEKKEIVSAAKPTITPATIPTTTNDAKNFGNSIVIGPFTGKETTPDGVNLFINSVGVNKDLALLQMRNEEFKEAGKVNAKIIQPRLILGGKLEGAALYNRMYAGDKMTDIDLTSAEINALAELNPWASGFMAIAYDNTPGNPLMPAKRRIDNSSVKVDKAFMTFGNLSKTGFYTTIGQMWAPFGRFSTNMINDPITKFIGKVKARSWAVGYAPVGAFEPYASAFLFKGDAQYQKGNPNMARQYGGDVGFNFSKNLWSGELGVSYIANIADADGMQNTGSSFDFKGFAERETLVHRVGGMSVHGSIGYGNGGIVAEYITALKAFDPADLTFNDNGAKPKAFYTEGYYNLNMFNIPSTIALGYGVTTQSLGFSLPRQRYSGLLSLYFTPNVQLKLEVDHSINYSKTDSAKGYGQKACDESTLGHFFDTIMAQIGIYF